MTYFKSFGALLFTLLIVHACNSSHILKDDDIKEIVVEVSQKVLDVFDQALNKANETVNKLETDKIKIQAEIVAFAIEEGKILNAHIIKFLNDLKDGATDEGKLILDCIAAEEDKTDAAFKKIATDIGNCAAGENTVVLAALRYILSQLNDIKTDFQNQVVTLSSCSGIDIVCLMSFANSAVETVKKIPAVISDDYQKFIDLIHEISKDISGCSADVFGEFKSGFQGIFNDVVVCIKNT